jgi:hypothetical protein
MSPRDRFLRIFALAGALASWQVFTVPASVWAQATPPAAPERPAAPALAVAPAPAAAESDLGERVRARFEVDVLRDGILLRPLASSTPVRSIELSDDDEVLVNGKEFNEEELEGFLGADGRLVLELARLDADDRRARLGFREAGERDAWPEPGDVDVSVEVPGIPDVPGVPRIRVRGSREDRVSVGRSIEVGPGETARDVVCIGCSVDIAGHASGDAVAVGGSVRIRPGAVVEGNGVAVGGSLELEPGAVVEGDGVTVGGAVEVAEGAQILGQQSSVGLGGRILGPWGDDDEDDDWALGFSSTFSGFVWSLFRAVFLALVVGLCLLVARPAVAAAERRLAGEPWKALFAGLLTQLLFLPVLVLVTVILAVSIVGIPLLVLVPVALVALIVGAVLGFAAVATSFGRTIAERFGNQTLGLFATALVGVLAIQGLTILGRLIGIPGGVLGFFGFALIALGFCIKYVAWTLGLGAMTLVAFGRDWRRARSEPVPAVAPRPLPSTPASEAPPIAPPDSPEPPPPPATERSED